MIHSLNIFNLFIMIKFQTQILSSGQIVLNNLPFDKGEIVEIIIVKKNEIQELLKEWKNLLKQTQSHVDKLDISDLEINQEIQSYREQV